MALIQLEELNPLIDEDCLQSHLKSIPTEFEDWVRESLNRRSLKIDFVYPHPLNKTLLEVACCEGRVEHVKVLLKYGAKANQLNDVHNSAPIHCAAAAGHADVLQVLLQDGRCNPDLKIQQETALQIAVGNDSTDCVRVLLENDADPNITNSEGLTPIYIAARKANRVVVELILEISKFLPQLDDFHHLQDGGKLTTRQILQKEFLGIKLPPAGVGASYIDESVFSCSDIDELDFLKNLRSIPNYQLTYTNLKALMTLAATFNYPDALRELLKKGRRYDCLRCVHNTVALAVMYGSDRALREILTIDAEVENKFLLMSSQLLGNSHRFLCFKLILSQPNINVRYEDSEGNTPLHYAASLKDIEAVRHLLTCGSFLGDRNVRGVPPLAHMSLDALSDLFDDCICIEDDNINCNKSIESLTMERCNVEFDYNYLITPFRQSDGGHEEFRKSDEKSILSVYSEMEVLAYIAEHRALQPLLKHPLLSSYIHLKWHIIQYHLWANFVFYFIFYTLMNVYLLSTNHMIDSSSSSQPNSSNLTSTVPHTISHQLDCLGVFTVIFLTLLAMREYVQLISSPGHYLSNFENILELVLIVFSVWTLVAPNPQIDAVVILLSAWELVSLMGQHPCLCTSVAMLKIVTKSFLRFFFPFSVLIVAFALAFSTLFYNTKDHENFFDVGHSLFKTIIMLTGEFGTNDIPFVSHPVLSRCIFVLFVFLIAIVMLNLLNGLAVSDTAKILKKSEILYLIVRVKSICYFEGVVVGLGPLKILRRWYTERTLRRLMFKPPPLLAMKTQLFPKYLSKRKVYVRSDKSNMTMISEEHHLFGASWNLFKMHPLIVRQAREILSRRESRRKASMSAQEENEKIIAERDTIKAQFDTINAKFDAINAKFDRLETAICKSDRGNVGKSLLCRRTKSEGDAETTHPTLPTAEESEEHSAHA